MKTSRPTAFEKRNDQDTTLSSHSVSKLETKELIRTRFGKFLKD